MDLTKAGGEESKEKEEKEDEETANVDEKDEKDEVEKEAKEKDEAKDNEDDEKEDEEKEDEKEEDSKDLLRWIMVNWNDQLEWKKDWWWSSGDFSMYITYIRFLVASPETNSNLATELFNGCKMTFPKTYFQGQTCCKFQGV